MLRHKLLDPQAITKLERQRLFAEHVLARLQRLHDLLGMERRRRDQEHRVHVGIREEFAEVGVQGRHTQFLSGPGKLVLHRPAWQ